MRSRAPRADLDEIKRRQKKILGIRWSPWKANRCARILTTSRSWSPKWRRLVQV